MDNVDNYIQILIETLQKQVNVLERILEVTKEQSEIAASSDFDEVQLEESMNRKEIMIARLNELDDGFTSVYGRVRKEVKGKQDIYRRELLALQKLIKRCTELGVEIRVLEQRNRERLTRCFANQHKSYATKKNAASVASHYNQIMNHQKMMDSYLFNQKK